MNTLSDRLLRPSEVTELLSVSRTTLWRMTRRGELPKPMHISAGAVGWRQSTIQEWLDRREFEANRNPMGSASEPLPGTLKGR